MGRLQALTVIRDSWPSAKFFYRSIACRTNHESRITNQMKHFDKILIANRGEIALRVMRTCRALGIASVAVYSDADARSPHARFADEAARIGVSASAASYLNIEKIIEAAKKTGAEAIHPGYGFLSENADFADACASAGIVFIGPASDAIRKMGLKSAARRLVAEAGVPIVPGYDGEDQSLETLRDGIFRAGLPVLIKASAGGGGRGMRVVRDAGEIQDAIQSARREAEKAFGDGSLLVEKYIEQARHIEFQILGDEYGNLIHLFERDCSIQRRHQKIIEESPSPVMTAELREEMGRMAVEVGRAINYSNAGTVEFILAPSGEFYFIEVNTRLQVEHPVTEMITGLDLVRLQIEISEGRRLEIAQEDIKSNGHAIEARLYAEDPDNGFLPSTGKIHSWESPSFIEGLRLDSGIEQGTEIGIHYDPMLAKLIAHAPDRITALRKLGYGLKRLSIQGVETNRNFLIRLLEHEAFRRGEYHTAFIEDHQTELIGKKDAGRDMVAAIAVALYLQESRQTKSALLSRIPANYRNNPFRAPSVKLQAGGEAFDVLYREVEGKRFEVNCRDSQFQVEVLFFQPGSIRLSIDGIQRLFQIAQAGNRFFVHSSVGSQTVTRLERYPKREGVSDKEVASAPMPGRILKILITEGQQVAEGDALIVLEAMKMEQTIKAARNGKVEAILVGEGDVVSPGEMLLQITSHE